jgi:hypothetical protein
VGNRPTEAAVREAYKQEEEEEEVVVVVVEQMEQGPH